MFRFLFKKALNFLKNWGNYWLKKNKSIARVGQKWLLKFLIYWNYLKSAGNTLVNSTHSIFFVRFTSLYITEHIKPIELTVFYSFLLYLIAFFKILKRVTLSTHSFLSVLKRWYSNSKPRFPRNDLTGDLRTNCCQIQDPDWESAGDLSVPPVLLQNVASHNVYVTKRNCF